MFDHDHVTIQIPFSVTLQISRSRFAFSTETPFLRSPVKWFRPPVTGIDTTFLPARPSPFQIHGSLWFSLPLPGTGSAQEERRRICLTAMGYCDCLPLPVLSLNSLFGWFAGSHVRRFLYSQPHFSPLTVQNRLHRLVSQSSKLSLVTFFFSFGFVFSTQGKGWESVKSWKSTRGSWLSAWLDKFNLINLVAHTAWLLSFQIKITILNFKMWWELGNAYLLCVKHVDVYFFSNNLRSLRQCFYLNFPL